jgi:ligand-binding sensor domain-containing protein
MRSVPRVPISALVLAAVLSSVCPLDGTLAGYARRVWHAEDGLPEEAVQSFAQTSDHFLWIGTTGGLVRFDGAQFVVFDRDNTPAIHENSIFCLLAAADGTLWIGTEGGGVVSYRNRSFHLWTKADGLANGYIRALREDHEGRVWMGTDDGLYRWQSGRIERMDGRDGVPASSIHSIFVDRQQHLWAGGFHFLRFDGDHAVEFHLPGGLEDNVKSILQTRDGALWVGTVSGLQRSSFPLGPSPPVFSRVGDVHSTVRTLLEDDDGTLWIGTIGEGLIRYQNGRFSNLSTDTALPSKTILSSFAGSGHNVWIGTQAGLVRLNKTAASTFVLPDFADADFGTIFSDRDGAVWVTSSHLFRITGRHAESLHLPGPLSNVRIRNVFRDSSGTLWFGTEGKGAFRWVDGAPVPVPLIQPYVRAFAEDRAGGVWVGTDGGYCRWRPENTRCFEEHESVRALYVDRQGDVWVGKDRGLTRLRSGSDVLDSPIPRPEGPEGVGDSRRPRGGLVVRHAHQRPVPLEVRPIECLHNRPGSGEQQHLSDS